MVPRRKFLAWSLPKLYKNFLSKQLEQVKPSTSLGLDNFLWVLPSVVLNNHKRCLSSLIFRELSDSSSSENISVFVLVLNLSPNYSLAIVLVLVLVLATNMCVFWSERSACSALRRRSETKCPLYLWLFFFFFFLLFSATYFSPRRSYCMVPKFCMGF